MNEYFIEDKYHYQDYKYLYRIIDSALNKLKLNNVSFSIILTDDQEVKDLNNKYRGINNTTDVLSFALNDQGSINLPINLLGDIYISIPKMKEQAINYKTGEKRELSFLIIHGLLHLLGYNHLTEEDEKIMISLQKELLK
ncbi:MAG: rRNA maturation RNase YbeY [Bacilli bacterium]|nr:rRNA maturation RNase YbeY [Bacilli bacterium]MDD4406746.1 rRNA maturation RNase YbeY [Bacilli bacterium]